MKTILRFLEKIPIFLFLIPLFVVVHIEKEYLGLIEYRFVYKQIIELFIAPIAILLLTYLFFRNRAKTIACTLFFLIIFYFFADLKDWLMEIAPNTLLSSYKLLIPVTLIVIIVIMILVKRSNSRFNRLILFANAGFSLFILGDLVSMKWGNKHKEAYTSQQKLQSGCVECIKPDIYYLIFDSYTSSEKLKQDFGYDNSRIDTFLARKGFYQLKHSRSNYNFTSYSVGSTLHMNYLGGVNPGKKTLLRDYLPYLNTIRNNPVIDRLKQEGYEIVNHSIFDFEDNKSTIPQYDHWDFAMLYKRHNIFQKINMEIGWMLSTRLNKNKPVYISDRHALARDQHDSLAIAALKKTLNASNTQPRFVYTHIEIPHAPFSFDSTGKRYRTPLNVSPEKDKIDYLNQLIYSNTILVDLVETIFQKSRRPFIVILQGDHGYRNFNRSKGQDEFDNLSAFYFYNRDYRLLYDSMSNVNTFRVVLNTFFNSDYPLIRDSTTYLPY